MSEPEDKPVEGEIVSGFPEKTPPPAPGRTFFHPLSGVVILGIDWLAFGADFFSGFLMVAGVSVAAFALTFWAVYGIQERLHGDGPAKAAMKALIGAVAAGVPFPVTGTMVGAAILVLSGLPTLRKK